MAAAPGSSLTAGIRFESIRLESLAAGFASFAKFAVVGASGLVVNTAALGVLTGSLGASITAGLILSTQLSTTTNFVLSERFVFNGRNHRHGAVGRYAQFSAVNNLALLVRAPMVLVLTGPIGAHLLVANLVSLATLMLVRFGVADRLIWQDHQSTVTLPEQDVAPAQPAAAELPVLLDVTDAEQPQPWANRWRKLAIFVSIAAPAAVLRLAHLNALGFNSDEAVYAGQAASIAGDARLQPYFPIFRAHPLLFQTVLSVVYRFGTSPLAGRLLTVACGLATVAVTYRLGLRLYDRRTGAVAALLLGVMPYHVVVSRQVLLDVPMVFFSTLALLLLARFADTGRVGTLYATSAVMGLTVITNERSLVLLASVYVFLALAAPLRLRFRHMAISMLIFVIVISPFPVSILFSGKQTTGSQFLAWQLFRRPNHDLAFYAQTVPTAIGLLVLLAALAALWQSRGRRTWRETLLVCWMVIPLSYFELWPVKGFQYLLPVAPVVAILAARAITSLALRDRQWGQMTVKGTHLAIAATLLIAGVGVRESWSRITPASAGTQLLAGSGGIPGGREAGRWVYENVPEGSTLLTIGPSMANIMEWYGDRQTYGLSVSSNPLHRNPVYEPIVNPDLALRNNEVQYLVWDAYSASRSQFFSDKLLVFVERYHGRAVHREFVPGISGGAPRPVIVIYEVRP